MKPNGPAHLQAMISRPIGGKITDMAMADGFRLLTFLGGKSLVVPESTCRGCLMNEIEADLPDVLDPVFDDGTITVRQDAEWAVPGFMIVGLRPHIGAIDQMPLAQAHRVITVVHHVRRAMREALGLEAVQMYQEEKLDRPHFHLWMLPLWPDVMRDQPINPRIYESNIAEYLSLFNMSEHGDAVRECIRLVREYCRTTPELVAMSADRPGK